MKLMSLGLPSDSIIVWEGLLPDDPAALRRAIKGRQGSGDSRVVVRVPNSYPELDGGDYMNPHLFGLVQDALSQLGLVVTRQITSTEESVIAVLPRCALEIGESYSVVNAEREQITGSLHIFGDFSGTKIRHYSDGVMLDFVMLIELIGPFKRALRDSCTKHRIPYHDLGVSPHDFPAM